MTKVLGVLRILPNVRGPPGSLPSGEGAGVGSGCEELAACVETTGSRTADPATRPRSPSLHLTVPVLFLFTNRGGSTVQRRHATLNRFSSAFRARERGEGRGERREGGGGGWGGDVAVRVGLLGESGSDSGLGQMGPNRFVPPAFTATHEARGRPVGVVRSLGRSVGALRTSDHRRARPQIVEFGGMELRHGVQRGSDGCGSRGKKS